METWVLFALLAGCAQEESPAAAGSGGGSTPGSSNDAQSGAQSAVVSASASSGGPVSVASSGATTSSGMGMVETCDPPAEPGSLYDQPAVPYSDPLSTWKMCRYRGKVIFIVNTAAL